MADFKDRMADYVPVNERLAALLDKYPDASLQSEIVELTDTRVTIKAIAYRTPDDARPGIGHSSMEIPGGTPYTRGSEIENAETSAWGRAIAALGFEVKRGMASREEVANHSERSRGPARAASTPSGSAPAGSQYRREELASLMAEKSLDLKAIEVYANLVGIPKGERATNEQMDALIDAVRGHGIEEALEPAVAPAVSESGSAPLAPTAGTAGDAPSSPAVPPKPGSDEFKALPPVERAAARVYHQTHAAEPAEQMRAALTGGGA